MARNWSFGNYQDLWSQNFGATPAPTPVATPAATVKTATPTPIPVPKTTTPATTQPTSEIDRYNKNFMKGGFLSKATDVLSYPSMKTEQFLTGGKGYESTVKNLVGENKQGELDWNDVVSTVARLVLDPLNVVPIGKVAGIAGKFATKVPTVAKAVDKISDVAKIAKTTPLVKGIATRFIKGYDVPGQVVKATEEVAPKVAQATEDIVGKLKNIFKGMNKAETEAVATFLEPQNAAKGVDLAALKSSFGDRWGVIQNALHQVKQINQELVRSAAQRGNIKNIADMTSTFVSRAVKEAPEQLSMLAEKTQIPNMSKKAMSTVEELYRRPYYYHVGESGGKNLLQKAKELLTPGKEIVEQGTKFPAKKLGISGGYWKERTGGAFTKNAPLAVAKRQVEQKRDEIIQDLLKNTARQYGKKVEGEIPEGYRLLKPSRDAKQFYAEFKNVAFPKNVANYLEQTYSNSGALGTFIDTFHRYWKQFATSYNPSFSINNLIGNLYNGAYLSGMRNPKRVAQMIKGGFSEAEKALVKESGILKEGEIPGKMISEAFAGKSKKIGSTIQNLARNVENNGRSALFLDSYEKAIKAGADKVTAMKQAADKVGEFMFNYQSALTPFESKQMKRITPFYTWARKNTELQAKALWNQTGKQANALKLLRSVNSGQTPEDISIPTPMKDVKTGKNLRYRVQLPIQSLLDIGGKGGETARDMVSPVIKLPIELARSLMSGQAPIDYYSGQTITNPNLPKKMQVGDWVKYLGSSLLKPARTMQKISQAPTDLANIIRSIVGGFSVDQGKDAAMQEKMYQTSEKKKALQTEINKAIKNGDLKRAKELEQYLLKQ